MPQVGGLTPPEERDAITRMALEDLERRRGGAAAGIPVGGQHTGGGLSPEEMRDRALSAFLEQKEQVHKEQSAARSQRRSQAVQQTAQRRQPLLRRKSPQGPQHGTATRGAQASRQPAASGQAFAPPSPSAAASLQQAEPPAEASSGPGHKASARTGNAGATAVPPPPQVPPPPPPP